MKTLTELKKELDRKQNWITTKKNEIAELDDELETLKINLGEAVDAEDEKKIIEITNRMSVINASIDAKERILSAKAIVPAVDEAEVKESAHECINKWDERISKAEVECAKAFDAYLVSYAEMCKLRNNALNDRVEYLKLLNMKPNDSRAHSAIKKPKDLVFLEGKDSQDRMIALTGMAWFSVARSEYPI